jgi:nicotinate-nucleotide pyrophosphorylase (carboxylating)
VPIETAAVERWLHEDIGHHDVTNDVPGAAAGRLVATEAGVAAGLDAARAVFEYLDVGVVAAVDAGTRVTAGDQLLAVEGAAKDVLRGERVAANLVGHASGVATATRRAVDAAREVSDDVTIAATRKTTPGLRGVEKRAVVAGGGDTHRLDCSHMAMVKENHIAQLGLESAVERCREHASFVTKVECEVESPADAPRAADAGADIVLLDNMSPAETARAVDLLEGAALTEASGGIGIAAVPDYAATDVDVISMGSLTHSATQLDVSFRVD